MAAPPPDPAAVRLIREQQALLGGIEGVQQREFARRWLQIEHSLDGQIQALAEEAARLSAAGKSLPMWKLAQVERFQSLIAQAQQQLLTYTAWAADYITEGQRLMARLGIEHGTQVLAATGQTAGLAVTLTFDRIAVEATANIMFGASIDGQPLRELLKLRMVRDETGLPLPGTLERLSQSLVNGVSQGWSPYKTAAAMQNDLSAGLDKALLISRTETLRAYRKSQDARYQASRQVTGQKRVCQHNGRVCPACLADEGHVYPIGVEIPDHPRGGCRGVPVLKDEPEPEFMAGEDWLATQPESVQRNVLGKGRFDAWKSGDVQFADFVTHTTNPIWGGSVQVTPLKALAG